MWKRLTIQRWAKRLTVLAAAVISLRLALHGLELAAGHGSVGSVVVHPLHLCAHFAKEGPLELLLEVSVTLGPWSPLSVDATNAFGMTALHTAALAGTDWAASILLDAGADPLALNARNETVLMVARSRYSVEKTRSGPRRIAAYLINAGACEREVCQPEDVEAMREWEVLAAKRSRFGAANNHLPGGPQLSIDKRGKLYDDLWEKAVRQHGVGGVGQCEVCAWLADMHAALWQRRREQFHRTNGLGQKEKEQATLEASYCRDNATLWLARSFQHNPTHPRFIARQRTLLSIADKPGPATERELALRGDGTAPRRVQLERQHPTEPIMLVRGLLTEAECAGLLKMAEEKFNVSQVGGMGDSSVSKNIRNSETGWIHAQEAFRDSIDAIVSELIDIPVSHSEHPQVVRYPLSGGFYKAHMDTSDNRLEMLNAGRSQIEGERVVTVLAHLTEGFGGGATEFTQVPVPEGERQDTASQKEGAMTRTLQIGAGSGTKGGDGGGRPMQLGDALVFYSLRRDGSINTASRHQGMPTEEADPAVLAAAGIAKQPHKVICNFWYREKRWWGYTHF